MIYITGDLHGNIDISKLNTKNFPEQKNLTKSDYLIILGDFGLIWNNSKEEKYWLKWLNSKPWTTLFIDGNHENHEILNSIGVSEAFGGGVHRISDSIYHLMRGEVYTIENKKFFCFGGAESIDKMYRKEYVSWWKEEIPSMEQMQNGIDNLHNVDYQIDYVLTHTCPSDVFDYVVNNYKNITELERYLNHIKYRLDEREIDYQWYFGHFHKNLDIKDQFHCLYKEVRELL
jgi:hypothetical protein